MEEKQAVLTKVIFQSDDQEFAVAEFIDAQTAKRFRASGKLNAIGKKNFQQSYKLFGEWIKHPKHGECFQLGYAEPIRPTVLSSLVPFLANNVKGVGEKTAARLIEESQAQSVDEFIQVCTDKPETIYAFFKKKSNTAQGVIQLLTGDEAYRNIMLFLHSHAIPSTFADRIYRKYGKDSVTLLTENPYRLIRDFSHIGFKKADDIACKLGLPLESQFRLEAAFVYSLEKATSDGHCCLPRDELLKRTAQILSTPQVMVKSNDLLPHLREIYKKNRQEDQILFEIRKMEEFGQNETLFYLPHMFSVENNVVEMFFNMLSPQEYLDDEDEKKEELPVRKAREVLGDVWEKLSQEQKQAVELSQHTKIMILTGGPGCGKTFVLRSIYECCKAQHKKVALCAPTGRAAKRMSSAIGAEAFTIHKLLKIGGGANVNDSQLFADEESLGKVDTVIVDEASMLSLDLLHLVLSAVGNERQLILVGDPDQLPSVAAGNCLRDLINSQSIPIVRLTKVFRQEKENPIPVTAKMLLNGIVSEHVTLIENVSALKNTPLCFVDSKLENFSKNCVSLMQDILPNLYPDMDLSENCQILVPMRKGDAGQDLLNTLLQQELNPQTNAKPEVQVSPKRKFRAGDKVIQLKNNYEKSVFNGDMGRVLTVGKKDDTIWMEVEFDSRLIRLEDDECEDIDLCYAMTIHKSQGSEFPLCVIPLFTYYYTMLDRNLIYTALTRAKNSVILIGDMNALKMSIRSFNVKRRYTALAEVLRKKCLELDFKSDTRHPLRSDNGLNV